MVTIQCKMCGGTMSINGETVVTCPHCGTVQTLPRVNNPANAQLFYQICQLMQKKEFAQATEACQRLLAADRNDPEAHWLMALCRYGVTYAKTADSGAFVPTVNTPQSGSFMEDQNYRAALQCADGVQKPIYTKQAEQISSRIPKKTEKPQPADKDSAKSDSKPTKSTKNPWKRWCMIALIMAFLFAGGLGYCIWDCALGPRREFNAAVALMEEGKYEEALAAFQNIFGYAEVDEQVKKCNQILTEEKYVSAQKHLDAGDVVGAYELWISLDGYKDSDEKAAAIYDEYQEAKLKGTAVGDILYFGAYELSADSTEKELMQWVVLDVQDGKALIVSQSAIAAKPFHQNYKKNSWETCTLRSWLNQDFLNAAFTATEQTKILVTTVSAASAGEKDTQDRLFLLSAEEVQKYFATGTAGCKPTGAAKAAGAYVYDDSGNCWWWLRTQGSEENCAAFVDGKGDIRTKGNRYDYGSGSVRPAMWISLEG